MSQFEGAIPRTGATARTTCVRIDPARVDVTSSVGNTAAPLEAMEGYFRIWLVQVSVGIGEGMPFLGRPTIFSLVNLVFGDRRRTFPYVASFPEPQGERNWRTGAVRPLTPLLPFDGGAVEIQLGLFGAPGDESHTFQMAKMAELSARVVGPEPSGVLEDMLELGSRLRDFAAGLRNRFALQAQAAVADTLLTPGYYAVVDESSGGLPAEALWVREGRLHAGETAEHSSPVTWADYLLFRVETRTDRDDWDCLTGIAEPYRQALEVLGRVSYEADRKTQEALLAESRESLVKALLAAARSYDLTKVIGRHRVLEALQSGYSRAAEQMGLGATPGGSESALSLAMENTISADEARSRGHVPIDWWAAPALKSFILAPPLGNPPPQSVVVSRTPHMDVLGQPPFRPADKFSVRVFADTAAPRAGESVRKMTLEVPPTLDKVSVDVWLAGTEHFVISDSQEKVLTLDLKSDVSAEVFFDVTVSTNVNNREGARLWAYFNYEGRPCGQVSLPVALTSADQPRSAAPPSEPLPTQPSAPPPRPPPPNVLAIESEVVSPDLTIEITDPRGDLRALLCRISSPHLPPSQQARRCRWILPQKADELVPTLLARLALPDTSPPQTEARLRGTGAVLWDSVPQLVKDVVWQLIDAGQLKTILVVSAEPYFPWEMIVPSRIESGQLHSREPIGVEFAVGRWVPIDHRSPPQRVGLSSSLVIAPAYPGPSPRPLAHAAAEAQDVCNRVSGKWLKPARFLEVSDALTYSRADLVHFVCHGAASAAPGIQALYLEDTQLDSIQLAGLSATGAADCPPFVFLNACEVGRPVLSLTGVGGFAREFIKRGAAGVVAPLWSVKDDLAHEVAEAFYERLSREPAATFGEVMREIRGRAYAGATRGNDSYAAYCFYGDPCARAPLLRPAAPHSAPTEPASGDLP